MTVEDPFYSVRDDVLTALRNAENLFERHRELLSESPTTTRQEREWLCTELRNSLRAIDWDLEDLEQTISIVERNPRRWRLSPDDLQQRKGFVENSRSRAKDIRERMATTDNRFKERNLYATSPRESPMLQRNSQNQYRYTRFTNSDVDLGGENEYVHDTMERQQLIISQQDDNLDKIGGSVRVLHDMSHKISGELDEQAIMLEDVGHEMDRTETKLDSVMKKLAKVTHLSNDKRQCYVIISLVVVLLVVIILFVVL